MEKNHHNCDDSGMCSNNDCHPIDNIDVVAEPERFHKNKIQRIQLTAESSSSSSSATKVLMRWVKHHMISSSSLGLLVLLISMLLMCISNDNSTEFFGSSLGSHYQKDENAQRQRATQHQRRVNELEEVPLSIEEVQTIAAEDEEATMQRQLGKHHKHKHRLKPIDYTTFSCNAMERIQSKYPDRFSRCEFAKNCNEGDGIIFPTLFCDEPDVITASVIIGKGHHPHKNNHTVLLLLLALALLLLFRLLNSTTDEFFSPGLELFSLKLGLPPRFAGVTLLALGNGAPDVAATMNAILEDERHGYEMALGELTGTSMFVSGVILGVIVSLSGDGEEDDIKIKDGNSEGDGGEDDEKNIVRQGVPCRGPLLRDISVLILVCVVSMSYLKDGVIDYGFVYTMLGMYVVYVLLVLGADAYHIFYHAPSLSSLTVNESGSEDDENECQEMIEKDEPLGGRKQIASGNSTARDEEKGSGDIIDEQTPLVSSSVKSSFLRSVSAPAQNGRSSQRTQHNITNISQHMSLHVTAHQHQAHSHTISETVIEAMSNYSCQYDEPLLSSTHSHESNASGKRGRSSSEVDDAPSSPRMDRKSSSLSASASVFKSRGWAPMQDDGTEPLVIFHPHHAVHPHHGPGGLLFVRSNSPGDSIRHHTSTSQRQHSWSHDDRNEKGELKKSSSCDASPSKKTLSPSGQHATTTSKMAMQITTKSSSNAIIEDPADGDSFNNQTNGRSHDGSSRGDRPNSWGNAISDNFKEFIEHWQDFFTDIYRNDENSVLDVILLSVELPFTIIRKLTNPVPCDGYYCRPLVAISLALSPLWLRYYFSDQFGINIFSSYVGQVLSAITIATGLIVMRYAPGGEGPMDIYMVVPLTLYGFAIAATWLDSIADKLVQLLELFGILLRIPSTIMGLTVLAFGNSLQDLVANVSLSKKGLSTMATTACLAGPIFNLCVGLGFGFWALMKSTGKDEIHVELPRNIATGFWFTIANCGLIVFAGVVVGKGVIGRGYGYVACGLYVVYVVTSLYV